MKVAISALIVLAAVTTALPQHQHHSPTDAKPIPLIEGLGELHHPVTTTNRQAQQFFNQGLLLVYAFNHEEAIRSFKRAAELDPQLAMAHWGVALALGPNINMGMDAERGRLAYEAAQKALALSSKATERERAYIEALAKRYPADAKADLKKMALDYRNAMRAVAALYPDDLDAATLYAESIMVLNPWRYWSADGKPTDGTEELVAVLESVLRRNPNHIGANHYYIHAVEASPHPEWALPSAQRLKVLAPAAGHLIHMPAHIDMRVGNYEAAARSNAYAAEADREHFKNISGMRGMYPMMYYSHNMHFLAVAHAMQGRYEDAKRAADQLTAHMSQYISDGPEFQAALPMVDTFMPTATLVLVRFRRWKEIMEMPAPNAKLPATTALWRFARGMAYAAAGDLEKAEGERGHLMAAGKAMPAQATFGLSKAATVLSIAADLLSAKIAASKNDRKTAVELLRRAAAAEDTLAYNEPPDWYIPVRETLGGVLIASGEHAEAEKVFRADLNKNPLSGRSLFGLAESLKAQGKAAAAEFVQMQFESAWKNADTRLRLEDL